MSTEPLDRLLDQLNRGDEAAAEQVFREYEPFLRALVHRRLRPALRSKFDTMDVVQSVWADVVVGLRGSGWSFTDRAHLEAFLTRLARNRFVDRYRKHRAALAREEPLKEHTAVAADATVQPRPSQVVQGDELWEQMLALCPPAHHELLRLKRQGLPLAEIAARTGLHESSVRRILYDLARKIAEKRARNSADTPTRPASARAT